MWLQIDILEWCRLRKDWGLYVHQPLSGTYCRLDFPAAANQLTIANWTHARSEGHLPWGVEGLPLAPLLRGQWRVAHPRSDVGTHLDHQETAGCMAANLDKPQNWSPEPRWYNTGISGIGLWFLAATRHGAPGRWPRLFA